MTDPTTKPRTCRRCNGTGEHGFNRVWGTTCMACEGRGVILPLPAPAPLTPEQQADVDDFVAGMAAREAREAARKARREARRAAEEA